ncbi:hypothetical protein DFAR_1110095 [Desulfarculales bacterium]
MDEVRKAEAKERKLPKATRWAVLKVSDGGRLTEKQQQTLTELEAGGFANATAWRLKETLRWIIKKATSVRARPMACSPLHPPYPEVHSACHQNPGPGLQGGHNFGRACLPDPKPLDLQPF